MTRVYQNLIAGGWVDSTSDKTFVNVNPANTGDVVGLFQDSTAEDAGAAIAAARKARAEWRAWGAPRRGEILARAARIIERDIDRIAEGLTREEGKTLAEAKGETAHAVWLKFDKSFTESLLLP